MYSKPCHPLFGDLNYIVIFFDPIIYVPGTARCSPWSGTAQGQLSRLGQTRAALSSAARGLRK